MLEGTASPLISFGKSFAKPQFHLTSMNTIEQIISHLEINIMVSKNPPPMGYLG